MRWGEVRLVEVSLGKDRLGKVKMGCYVRKGNISLGKAMLFYVLLWSFSYVCSRISGIQKPTLA